MADGKGAEFEFPKHYSWPPFFTLQPVVETRAKQLKMWTSLVVGFCRATKKTAIDVAGDGDSKMFRNEALRRSLSSDDIRHVLDYMCENGFGKWQDDHKVKCVITWKKFEDWASAIYKWAKGVGHVGAGAICTLYEICEGDDARGQDFHGLDKGVILEALRTLQEQGRADLYEGSSLDEMGVKFLE